MGAILRNRPTIILFVVQSKGQVDFYWCRSLTKESIMMDPFFVRKRPKVKSDYSYIPYVCTANVMFIST
jgi:hypothetical protein